MQTESELERHFSATLGCKISVCVSSEPLDDNDLSEREKTVLATMTHALRRSSWLRGRSAIQAMVKRLREEEKLYLISDATALKMPHPHLSLSHSGDYAIAVSCLDAKGIGVDLESPRIVREGSSRFFLAADSEKEWQSKIDSSQMNDELLRLWTTKESLFKADLSNKDKTLNRYRVLDPSLHCGRASFAESIDGSQFQYSSIKFADYWLTVSISD